MFKLLLSGFIIFAWVTRIDAASFDCDKAKTVIEVSICANNDLSELDNNLLQSYQDALKTVINKNALKSEQKLWLKNIRNSCSDTNCLINVYHSRIYKLNAIETSMMQGYQIRYLGNKKVKLTYGNLKKIINLGGHIGGCLGKLYDFTTNESIASAPGIGIVSILKKPKITTLLLITTTSPNCNIQGQCGAGVHTDLIALTISDKLDIVSLNSFTLDDCYSRQSNYGDLAEWENIIKDMVAIIKPMGSKIKLDFEEVDDSNHFIAKHVFFNMEEPSKGFVVESSASQH
jgi:uncharacterized protein